jgi:hypothetical protein
MRLVDLKGFEPLTFRHKPDALPLSYRPGPFPIQDGTHVPQSGVRQPGFSEPEPLSSKGRGVYAPLLQAQEAISSNCQPVTPRAQPIGNSPGTAGVPPALSAHQCEQRLKKKIEPRSTRSTRRRITTKGILGASRPANSKTRSNMTNDPSGFVPFVCFVVQPSFSFGAKKHPQIGRANATASHARRLCSAR